MDGEEASPELIIAKLVEMGFEYSSAKEAVETVEWHSVSDAANYMLNGTHRNGRLASTSPKCCTTNKKVLGKRAFSSADPLGKMRQSSILDHFQSKSQTKRSKVNVVSDMPMSGTSCSSCPMEARPGACDNAHRDTEGASELISVGYPTELEIGPDWEQRVNRLLQKRFRYSSLKSFQREALAAWVAHKDCLILAATGSGNAFQFMFIWVLMYLILFYFLLAGKSLCFQIPALLSGKVVVVVSPLISLMHDQCLNLSKHGVSACFLGSGQPDNTVEQKAMKGMYELIYVCPETVLR